MGAFFDRIVENAQRGQGPCESCPAHETLEGRLVNPGLLNQNGELMFVTEEPSHLTDWEEYDSWAEYNEEWGEKFKRYDGGQFIERLLEPTSLTLDDVWVGDTIKCPTVANEEKGIPEANTVDSARHCRNYLADEVREIDPKGIITLGRRATVHTLLALGAPWDEVKHTRVTQDFGYSDFETEVPLVVSLHWAQRSIAMDEFVPVVKEAITDIVE